MCTCRAVQVVSRRCAAAGWGGRQRGRDGLQQTCAAAMLSCQGSPPLQRTGRQHTQPKAGGGYLELLQRVKQAPALLALLHGQLLPALDHEVHTAQVAMGLVSLVLQMLGGGLQLQHLQPWPGTQLQAAAVQCLMDKVFAVGPAACRAVQALPDNAGQACRYATGSDISSSAQTHGWLLQELEERAR